MFEGRHPDTGELLGRPHGKGAVPAFDVVLRPTKSVSVLYGLGDSVTGRAVLDAHHAGVREAVAYLDGHLGTRRGHGGVQHVSGQGVLAVGFDHRTSRLGSQGRYFLSLNRYLFLAAKRSKRPELLFASQPRVVHGVLACAVLAAQVVGVVQPVRSGRAE
jgi:TrwC relaxase